MDKGWRDPLQNARAFLRMSREEARQPYLPPRGTGLRWRDGFPVREGVAFRLRELHPASIARLARLHPRRFWDHLWDSVWMATLGPGDVLWRLDTEQLAVVHAHRWGDDLTALDVYDLMVPAPWPQEPSRVLVNREALRRWRPLR